MTPLLSFALVVVGVAMGALVVRSTRFARLRIAKEECRKLRRNVASLQADLRAATELAGNSAHAALVAAARLSDAAETHVKARLDHAALLDALDALQLSLCRQGHAKSEDRYALGKAGGLSQAAMNLADVLRGSRA